MTKALEAAARALWAREKARSALANSIISGTGDSIEPFEDCAESTWLPDAKAAVLAFLENADFEVVQRLCCGDNEGGECSCWDDGGIMHPGCKANSERALLSLKKQAGE